MAFNSRGSGDFTTTAEQLAAEPGFQSIQPHCSMWQDEGICGVSWLAHAGTHQRTWTSCVCLYSHILVTLPNPLSFISRAKFILFTDLTWQGSAVQRRCWSIVKWMKWYYNAMIYGIFPSNYYCMACIEKKRFLKYTMVDLDWVVVCWLCLIVLSGLSLLWVEGNNRTQMERNVVCMLYEMWCKSFSLLLYQYATYSMAWKKKTQLHSILMWSSCMYSSASLSNCNRYISALPIISIISIIGIFVIFLIEDTALKTCQCRFFVPHNQCRHLFFCSVTLLRVYTRNIGGPFGPLIMRYMTACCCRLCKIFHVHLGK